MKYNDKLETLRKRAEEALRSPQPDYDKVSRLTAAWCREAGVADEVEEAAARGMERLNVPEPRPHWLRTVAAAAACLAFVAASGAAIALAPRHSIETVPAAESVQTETMQTETATQTSTMPQETAPVSTAPVQAAAGTEETAVTEPAETVTETAVMTTEAAVQVAETTAPVTVQTQAVVQTDAAQETTVQTVVAPAQEQPETVTFGSNTYTYSATTDTLMPGFDVRVYEMPLEWEGNMKVMYYYKLLAQHPDSAPADFETRYAPTWVPEGNVQMRCTEPIRGSRYVFEVEFRYVPEKGTLFGDGEGYPVNFSQFTKADFYENYFQAGAGDDPALPRNVSLITIGGKPGILESLGVMEPNDESIPEWGYTLRWDNGDYIFCLSTKYRSLEDTVKIAESIAPLAE